MPRWVWLTRRVNRWRISLAVSAMSPCGEGVSARAVAVITARNAWASMVQRCPEVQRRIWCLSTSFPAGFDLDPDEAAFWQQEDWGYILVAGSFAEFIWRWWMDNEMFYRLVVEKIDTSADERAYVEQYGRPNRLG